MGGGGVNLAHFLQSHCTLLRHISSPYQYDPFSASKPNFRAVSNRLENQGGGGWLLDGQNLQGPQPSFAIVMVKIGRGV